MQKKAAVFILLGQSNAVGHGVPMAEVDRITEPMKNVFGLSRADNQSFDHDHLVWSGYTGDMNLAETQDHTWSVANALALQWQAEIDAGNPRNLPDLYIIQIAIGAQGVSDKFMWYPYREKKLVPGPRGTADFSLSPYACHILSMVNDSLRARGLVPEYRLHWRGGEEDTGIPVDTLKTTLRPLYDTLLSGLYHALGQRVKTILHLLPFVERCLDMDPSGESLKSMHFVNDTFARLAADNDNISLFDPCLAPHYVPDTRDHNLYIEDVVHYTPETNRWVASVILRDGFDL